MPVEYQIQWGFATPDKAGGRVLKGLVNRRADEAALYRSGS